MFRLLKTFKQTGCIIRQGLNHQVLCETALVIHPNIQACVVIHDGKLVAARIKPEVPIPKNSHLVRLYKEAELLVGIAKSEEEMYGKFRYVMTSHENMDHLLFHLEDVTLFAVSIKQPYMHDDVIARTQNLIGDISSAYG